MIRRMNDRIDAWCLRHPGLILYVATCTLVLLAVHFATGK